jgi:predicted nuclease of predicted toxin-antitoxin system
VEAVHVRDLGFSTASDHRIWRELIAPAAVLITRDLDLATIVKWEPSTGHVVLVSVGNCRNRALIALFERRWADVQRRLAAGERLIELA